MSQALRTHDPNDELDGSIAGRIAGTTDTPCTAPQANAPRTEAAARAYEDPSTLKRPTSRYGSVNDLVQRLTPRADPRDDDMAYRRILHDLQVEFPSESVLVAYELANLAADYLQAARMREAIDQLQNFEVYEEEHLREYEKLRQSAADHHAVLHIVHGLTLGEPVIATPEAAKRLASRVTIRVQNLQAEFVPPDETGDSSDAGDGQINERSDPFDDEFEREQRAEREAVWRAVEAAAESLGDVAAVEAILSNARKPSPAEQNGLVATLEWLCPDLRSPFIRHEPQVRNLMETTRRNPQAVLCDDSDRVKKLLLLDSGLRQIERGIDARVKTLMRLCHSRGRRR